MKLRPIEGEIFVIDKPLGWSSFHVVKKLRGTLTSRLRPMGIRKLKVGHAGTLDPLASGVMILCTGRSTRSIDKLQAGVKEYIANVRLGATTPSFDLEMPYDGFYPTEHITKELVLETLKHFKGAIDQVPPTYSACKVAGERAYMMARNGTAVELKPKRLVIDEIELTDYQPDVELPEADGRKAIDLELRIFCSKGTYIRALARDIGQALQSGAHLSALRRTRVGDYRVENALTIPQLAEDICVSPMEILDEEGNGLDVAPLAADRDFARMDKADILPFFQRPEYRNEQRMADRDEIGDNNLIVDEQQNN